MRNLRTAGARLIQTFGATTKMRGVNNVSVRAAPGILAGCVRRAGVWDVVGQFRRWQGHGHDGNINLIEKIKPRRSSVFQHSCIT